MPLIDNLPKGGSKKKLNEHMNNLTAAITAESTDEQYPSAKAVYDMLSVTYITASEPSTLREIDEWLQKLS